jgi:hypothetical protein
MRMVMIVETAFSAGYISAQAPGRFPIPAVIKYSIRPGLSTK